MFRVITLLSLCVSNISVHGMQENKTPVIVQISNNIPDTFIRFRAYCKTLHDEHIEIRNGYTRGIASGAAVNQFPSIPVWELYLIANPDKLMYECKQNGQMKKGYIPYSKNSSGYARIFDKGLEIWGDEKYPNICLWNVEQLEPKPGWHQGQEIQES